MLKKTIKLKRKEYPKKDICIFNTLNNTTSALLLKNINIVDRITF